MSGSMDDDQVHVVHVKEETVLTVMVFPEGNATILSDQPPEWVATVLRQLANTYAPDTDPMNVDVPIDFIETARTEIDSMIAELGKAAEPLTTQQIIKMLSYQHNLTNDHHRQALATTAAILLQRAVYS